jgi:hypothetical protein
MLDGPRLDRLLSSEFYRVEVRRLHWQSGLFGIRYIVGEVASRSRGDLGWIKIEFKLYNRINVQVGTASDHLRGFNAGCIWRFKAPVFSPDASRAPLADVTCEYGSVYHPTTACCLRGSAWPPSPEMAPGAGNGAAERSQPFA